MIEKKRKQLPYQGVPQYRSHKIKKKKVLDAAESHNVFFVDCASEKSSPYTFSLSLSAKE